MFIDDPNAEIQFENCYVDNTVLIEGNVGRVFFDGNQVQGDAPLANLTSAGLLVGEDNVKV